MPEKSTDREDGGPAVLALLVLGILAVDHPQTLDEVYDMFSLPPLIVRDSTAKRTAHELLNMLQSRGMRATSAAEILGSGFKLWSKYIVNVQEFIRRLLQLVMETSSQPAPVCDLGVI